MSSDLKGWIFGDYDYAAMCMPSIPYLSKEKGKLNFFAKNEKLPVMLAVLMGLQHAFAMIGGLITPPYVVARFAIDGFPFEDVDLQQYAISAALITSGICTIFNVLQISIPFSEQLFGKKLVVGSGVLSVMGTSFTFLPVFEIGIAQMKADGIRGRDAYGRMLGTVLVCSLFEMFLSFVSVKKLKEWFPPIITGVTVMLIGVALTGTGMKYWGGGVVCAEMGWKDHLQVRDLVGFGAGQVSPIPGSLCEAGDVSLGFGSPQFIGLGFSVICMLVIIEMFGSPFMKNSNVILALLFGYFVAGVSRYDDGGESLQYVTPDKIEDAPGITFLWVESFRIGFYAPVVLPLLIAFMVTTVETIGDLGATFEASNLELDTLEHTEAVQGALLCDGISSFLSSLFTSMPNTTFSQNNGVISMTKCASKYAGIACGIWLIIFGVLGKFAGVITSIPDCVIGGMTIFLFANVFTSGLKVMQSVDLTSRRARFVVSMAMSIGIGVTVWPYAFADRRASEYTAHFWPCETCNDTEKGIRNGISIFLSTGYCVGTVVALLLNWILPDDMEVVPSEKDVDMVKEELPTDESTAADGHTNQIEMVERVVGIDA